MATRRQVLGTGISTVAAAALGVAADRTSASTAVVAAPPRLAYRPERTGQLASAAAVASSGVQSRLMHNYRMAAAVAPGSEVVAVRNSDGVIELFTAGPDGTVWHYRPDPSAESGYSGASTGAKADVFNALCGSDGTLVLFTASGTTLSYLTRKKGDSSWSAPATISYTAPASATVTAIEKITIGDIGGQYYVGVLLNVTYPAVGGNAGNLTLLYSVWDPANVAFTMTSTSYGSDRCVWLGTDAASASFEWVDAPKGLDRYSIAQKQDVTISSDESVYPAVSVSATSSPGSTDRIFAVTSDDKRVYEFVPNGGSGGNGNWSVRSAGGLAFRQVLAVLDGSNATHLFAVTEGNELYHWQPASESPAAGFDDGTVIAKNVASIGAPAGGGDSLDLLAVGSGSPVTLTHLYWEPGATGWVLARIEVPASGVLEEYISYTSEASLYDAKGVPLVNTPVTITASEECQVSVNGAVHTLTQGQPLAKSTNAAGKLSIVQETGALSVPGLTISVPSAGQTIKLDASQQVRRQLADVKGDDLAQAKDRQGNYLIPDSYRTPENTSNLAEAVKQCVALAGPPAPGSSLTGLHRLAPAPDYTPWHLSFEGKDIVYERLDPAHADRLVSQLTEQFPAVQEAKPWIDDLGDFLAGVKDEFIHVVQTVMTPVENGASAVINCVIDGVPYVYDTILRTIGAALDMVETLFAKVGVFFAKLFEWVGFLFSWDDIVRTHTAITYTINQFLTFLADGADGFKKLADTAITDLRTHMNGAFNKAIKQLGKTTTLGGYVTSAGSAAPLSPDAQAGVSNTVVINALIDNAAGASIVSPSGQAQGQGQPQLPGLDKFQKVATKAQGTKEFAKIQDWFTTLGGSTDQMFGSVLADLLKLLKRLVNAILRGVRKAVNALLDQAKALVTGLQQSLNAAWNFPLLSALYKEKISNGAELTTLDLIALVIAVPATIVYKAMEGQAPFPDDASLTTFTSSFTAQTMLQATGLAPASTVSTVSTVSTELRSVSAALPSAMQKIFLINTGITLLINETVSAVADSLPPTGDAFPGISTLSNLIIVLDAFVLANSCPLFFDSSQAAMKRSFVHWVVSLVFWSLDFGYTISSRSGTLPEYNGDLGVGLAFLIGAFSFFTGCLASVGGSVSVWGGNLAPIFATIAKPLRLKGLASATGNVSCLVLAGIDTCCAGIGLGAYLSQAASIGRT